MNPLVELITAWDDYLRQHPDATVTGFCSNYLGSSGIAHSGQLPVPSSDPTDLDLNSSLSAVIRQFSTIQHNYAKLSLKELTDVEPEWFYFMNLIHQHHEIRKSEVVSMVFLEQSTGIDIINRIKKAGFLSERIDPTDKRARLLKLSPKGIKLLEVLRERFSKSEGFLLATIAEANKKLVLNILEDVVLNHRQLLTEKRNQILETLHPPTGDSI